MFGLISKKKVIQELTKIYRIHDQPTNSVVQKAIDDAVISDLNLLVNRLGLLDKKK